MEEISNTAWVRACSRKPFCTAAHLLIPPTAGDLFHAALVLNHSGNLKVVWVQSHRKRGSIVLLDFNSFHIHPQFSNVGKGDLQNSVEEQTRK